MKQGKLCYADLNPRNGSEQSGLCPTVIFSGNLTNEHLNTVICCPITTKVKNYKGNVLLKPNALNKLTQDSEILTFHIRSISKERLVRKIGAISKEKLQHIKKGFNNIWKY